MDVMEQVWELICLAQKHTKKQLKIYALEPELFDLLVDEVRNESFFNMPDCVLGIEINGVQVVRRKTQRVI